ncbi:MAG TPA: DUF3656 domain-containing protein, partial [Kofleriaceae bacterium]|nr:DUF3656 domain-containing protein [Kofleriaceae bacterium]
LKIEGRLKGPHYVATAVAQYRAAVASAGAEPPPTSPARIPLDEPSLHIAYSRGVSPGFLAGADHQNLVEGRFPRHRGVPLGRVAQVAGDSVLVVPDPAQRSRTGGRALAGHDASAADEATDRRTRVAPRAGMGVVFDRGRPDEAEEGGPIFAVDDPDPRRPRDPADGHWLRFGRPGPDLGNVHPGDLVWITSDPRISRAGEKAAEIGLQPLGRIALDVTVRGALGAPLSVVAAARGHTARAQARTALQPARGSGLSRAVVEDKLGALGGTPFHLGALDTRELADGLHLPVSELKELRRAVVAELTAALVRVDRAIAPGPVAHRVLAGLDAPDSGTAAGPAPIVVPLCRTDAQLDAVLDAGAAEVELDWMELVGLGRAVERARRRGARVGIATVRVQKPGEDKIDQHLARLAPDHVVVRSWGSLAAFMPGGSAARPAPAGPVLHGDFSLNVTNSVTASWVLQHGLATVTAAHDLDRDQLFALLSRAPRGRIAVTIHHHVPTFHTEHCVYAHLLSTGRDFRTCGRPCERHEVALRDRVGLVHPVVVDVGCRNTIFNAQAQTAASMVPELLARGVRRLRVELVRESADEAARVFTAYTQLVAGQLAPREAVRRAAVHEQFGVTRGTMRTLTVLR